MKLTVSLRWYIAIAFLILGLALVWGYSRLSADYFVRGMNNILALHMEKSAQEYLRITTPDERNNPKSVLGYTVTPQWTLLAKETQENFQNEARLSGKLLRHATGSDSRHSTIEFLFPYSDGDGQVYVTYQIAPQAISSMVTQNNRDQRYKLFVINTAATLALALVIWLLLRHVSIPVFRLVQWTRSLEPRTVSNELPDFTYPELNQLAQLIKGSFSSVQESLEREHRFLCHASHELRTPITTIRNNVELLRKLQEKQHSEESSHQQIIERLDRASLTMKHLTDTLLWLSREQFDDLPYSEVQLGELVVQLCEEQRYLLKNKSVILELETHSCKLFLPEVAVHIVLSNLIRNAFQHTWQGSVCVHQKGSEIRISNSLNSLDEEDLGFGLGLQLTQQLTEKLQWFYECSCQGGEYIAIVRLSQGNRINRVKVSQRPD